MEKCKNCGNNISGKYCSNCGQKAVISRYTFRHLFKEAAGTILELDSEFLRTVKALFVKPGVFIRNYLVGARKDYLSPFKFLFIVIALNFAFSLLTGEPVFEPVKITSGSGEHAVGHHWINLATHLVIIIFMIPMALGIKIVNKKEAYTFLEYYIFLVYIFTQTTLVYIFLLLLLQVAGIEFALPVKGFLWLICFTLYYGWGYINFFEGYAKIKVVKFILAYLTGLISGALPLLIAGQFIKYTMN